MLQWAQEQGIVVGYKDGTFRPDNTVTRRQVAVMLWRYQGRPGASEDLRFADVCKGDSAYKAIRWEAEAGVIKGSKDAAGNAVFKPDDKCLRRQIVTFLYRYARDVMKENVN